MRIQKHCVIPVKPAQAVGSICVNAYLIGTDLYLPGGTAQEADTLIEFHLHLIVLRPVFDGSLHIDSIGDVAKSAVEFRFLLQCQNIPVDLDVYFALLFVVIEKGNVILGLPSPPSA